MAYKIDKPTSVSLCAELGARLAKIRLSRNVTQEALAREAGIGLRTLRRLEAGGSCTLDSFLRIVIILGLADHLLSTIPAQDIRPIERIGARRSERKRARPARHQAPQKPWAWGEDRDG